MATQPHNGDAPPTRSAVLEDPRIQVPPEKAHSLTWLWLLLIVIVVAGLGWWGIAHILHARAAAMAATGAGAGARAVPVVAVKVHSGDLPLYIDGLGTVTPLNTVAIHTRVDGQLDQVAYAEGQMVKQGELLVQIDPRPFQVQKEQAEGSLIRDQALLKDAQLNLERYTTLLSQNVSVTQQQVDTQKALVAQYDGAVKTDQGQIDSAQLNITYCHVTAPLTGRIGLRLVDQGNIVHANDANPVAIITQMQPITVVFTVPEDSISRVIKAVAANPQGLLVEAWDRDLTAKLATGKLLAVDNQVDPSTGTVKIKAQFDNKNSELFPNEFVNARLLVDTLHQVTLVSSAAVQRGPNDIFAYVVGKDNVVELRHPLKLGPTEGEKTVIESGLSPGEVVVTDGVDKLQDKTQVSVRERTGKPGISTQPSATQPSTASGVMPAAGEERSAATQPAGQGAPHHTHHSDNGGAQ